MSPATLGSAFYRISEAEKRLERLEDETKNIGVTDDRVLRLIEQMRELRDEVSGLRKAIITAAISFAGGALLVAFTIFQTFGR